MLITKARHMPRVANRILTHSLVQSIEVEVSHLSESVEALVGKH
ncbi:MAG: hypothetical protein ACTTKF_06740 [Bacteroides sp.]